MPLGQATRKAVGVTYFSLETPTDMAECLDELLDIGYVGMVKVTKDIPGNFIWTLTISSESQPLQNARIGDVLIWDGNILAVITPEQFGTDYTIP